MLVELTLIHLSPCDFPDRLELIAGSITDGVARDMCSISRKCQHGRLWLEQLGVASDVTSWLGEGRKAG
jgi:hypothetical protein